MASALDPQIPLMVRPAQEVDPNKAFTAVESIENARALAQQRQAIADLRDQQTQTLAQNAADQGAINSAMQQFNGDPDQASDWLGKNGYQRAQSKLDTMTDAKRTAELKQATDLTALHTKTIGLVADTLNSIDPTDPIDYQAKASVIRKMAGSDPKVQALFQTSLPLPGEPNYDPSKIAQYVQSSQNAAIPYQDYWKQMQEAVKYQNEGNGVKALGTILDANKNVPDPSKLLGFIAAARRQGMTAETAQPFIDAVNNGTFKSDPLVFSKLGGTVNPEQAATMTGTVPGTTTPTETAKKDTAAASSAAISANASMIRALADKTRTQATTLSPEQVAKWTNLLKDPGSGVTLSMVPMNARTQVTSSLDPGDIQKLTAQDLAMANTAKKLLPMFSSVEDLAKQINDLGLMGSVGGRIDKIVAGESAAADIDGLTPVQRAVVGKFATEASLLQSGIAKAHAGMRGVGNEGLMKAFEKILGPGQKDLPTYLGNLDGAKDWMQNYADISHANGAGTTTGAPSAAPPTAKPDMVFNLKTGKLEPAKSGG